ncbi:hypothetical protein [Persephonella sp.]
MKDLNPILEEIGKHDQLLKYEVSKIQELGKLTPEDLENPDVIILLDAFIFRFIKTQSTIGEKLFPLFYEYLTGKNYTEASFIDILNTLEKYGFLSAQQWQELRKIRNQFVHLYPWELNEKVEAVETAIEKLPVMEDIYLKIKRFLKNENNKTDSAT